VNDFYAYFASLEEDCYPGLSSSHAIRTFDDAVALLNIINNNISNNVDDVLLKVRSSPMFALVDEEKLLMSIEFVIRCWLLLKFRIARSTPKGQRRRYYMFNGCIFPWSREDSLAQVLQKTVIRPTPNCYERDCFSEFLNVVDMNKIAGFTILWTNNLGEHLTIQGRFLYLFSQIAALKRLGASSKRYQLPCFVLAPTNEVRTNNCGTVPCPRSSSRRLWKQLVS
jgi:hypothetical protein